VLYYSSFEGLDTAITLGHIDITALNLETLLAYEQWLERRQNLHLHVAKPTHACVCRPPDGEICYELLY
jgi:hypothetical protein